MAKGKKIEDDVREEVGRLYLDESKRSPKAILDAMAENPAYKDRRPSERAVSNIISEMKNAYTPEQQRLDRPWQLRPPESNGLLPDGIHMEYINLFRAMLRVLPPAYGKDRLTIRIARWVGPIYQAMHHWIKNDERTLTDMDLAQVFEIARYYARRERWAIIEGKDLDTSDLDGYLAFDICRTAADELAYEAATEAGLFSKFEVEAAIRDTLAGQSKKEMNELVEEYRRNCQHVLCPAHGIYAQPEIVEIMSTIPESLEEVFRIKAQILWRDWPEPVNESNLASLIVETKNLAEPLRSERTREGTPV